MSGVREAAISLCRNGRPYGPHTGPRAFARRNRADAGGAPALPRDGISPRPPREFLISRSDRAGFLGTESARDQDGPRLAQWGPISPEPISKARALLARSYRRRASTVRIYPEIG